MPKKEDGDIREIMRGEKRRGASRMSRSLSEERSVRAKLAKALASTTEREFAEKIKEDFGISETSPQFARLLAIWRGQH